MLLAVTGLVLSLAYLVFSTDAGRSRLVPPVLAAVDDALAGRIELAAFRVTDRGFIELDGLRVLDPDDEEVLAVKRLVIGLDLSRLTTRSVGVAVEIDQPKVTISTEEDGSLSIARAFAPTHPGPRAEPPPEKPGPPLSWDLQLASLAVRGAELRYRDAAGKALYGVTALDLDARAEYGPAGGSAALKIRGQLAQPPAGALALDLAAEQKGDEVTVHDLRLGVGATALELVARGNLRSRTGRAAVLALGVDRKDVRSFAPDAPVGGDLAGTLYAEAKDGVATLALDLDLAKGKKGDKARVSAAARLPPAALAAGFDVAISALDPSDLIAVAPEGEVTVAARGRAAGKTAADLEAAVTLTVAPSRLRGGKLGPVHLEARAASGLFTVEKLDAAVPGATVKGEGRYSLKGAVGGKLSVELASLADLRQNLSAVLGKPLPPLGGSARLDADIAGTIHAPTAHLALSAPGLQLPGAAVAGLAVNGDLSGKLSAPKADLAITIARVTAGGTDVKNARLAAKLNGRAGDLDLVADVPLLGKDPVALRAVGSVDEPGERALLTELTLSYPGTKLSLEKPATVALAGPSVDSLALGDGAQRLVATGGLERGGAKLAATLAVEGLDLGKLPRGVVPEKLGLAGRLTLDGEASGSTKEPLVSATVRLEEGAAMGLEGLALDGQGRFDGKAKRASGALDLRRGAGGRVRVVADLPAMAFAKAKARDKVLVTLDAEGLPLAEASRLAKLPAPLAGTAGLELKLSGTAGEPALVSHARLADVAYEDFRAVAVDLALDAPGKKLTATLAVEEEATRALDLVAALPLDLGDALADPGKVGKGLPDLPLTATLGIPGYPLARLANRRGLPAELAGTLRVAAKAHGTIARPRAEVVLDLADASYERYQHLGLHAKLDAEEAAVTLSSQASLARTEVLRLDGKVGLPPERLGDAAAREKAPLALAIDLARTELARAAGWTAPAPLDGEAEGKVRFSGSLSAPEGQVDLKVKKLVLSARPVGDVALVASYAEAQAAMTATLLAAAGGDLKLSGSAALDLSLPAIEKGLDPGGTNVDLRLLAHDVDLGFLPAVAPDAIRAASGKFQADIAARGPLAKLRPKGTAVLKDGKLAIAELGEWRDLGLDLEVDADKLSLRKLQAKSGSGSLALHGDAVGLSRKDAPADFTGELRMEKLPLQRSGEMLAQVDMEAKLKGGFDARHLDADLAIPSAVLVLPSKPPRSLQSLEQRKDIVVLDKATRARRKKAEAAKAKLAAGVTPPEPFHSHVHVLVPNRFFIKDQNPAVDIEIKADLEVDMAKELTMTGTVDTLRGRLEPIGGRVFEIAKGQVQFTGGAPTAALLDVVASYDNPAAKVKVNVSGPALKPVIKMSSSPPMDEAQIAVLIATGRTQLKAGGGAAELGATEAAGAVLGAVATQAFKGLLADKLPVDTVSIDSAQLRLGKYVTDKIFLGYTHRFNAREEQGENVDEGRFEYQIDPRWSLEATGGTAGTGGANLLWSRDY